MSACIPWHGVIDRSNGYGRRKRGGKICLAHRVAWEDAHGPIPDGLHIDHLCRNRACVNVDHMEVVTSAENSRRGARAKLNWDAVHEIRSSDLRTGLLAQQFGVCRVTIQTVRRRESWWPEP